MDPWKNKYLPEPLVFPIPSILQPIFMAANKHTAQMIFLPCLKFLNPLHYPSKWSASICLQSVCLILPFMTPFISAVHQMSSLGSSVLQLLILRPNKSVSSNICIPSFSNESALCTPSWYYEHLFKDDGFLMLSNPKAKSTLLKKNIFTFLSLHNVKNCCRQLKLPALNIFSKFICHYCVILLK